MSPVDFTFIYELAGRLLPFDFMQARFMQQALVGLLLIAPMCAAMGIQVVNSRMAFFSDAISHSAFTGVAIGLLLGVEVRVSMAVFALLTGLAITALAKRTSLSTDTLIGVFFSSVVAFGIAMVSRYRSVARDLQQFLYGDILTIGDSVIFWLIMLFLLIFAFQLVAYNRLLYVSLSPILASVHRVKTSVYQYVYAGLLSLVVIFAVWAVGVLLVTALLIVPAAAGRNFANSAGSMFWWALLVGWTSAVAGLIISAQPWAGTATGATVILFAFGWFMVSHVFAALRKTVSQ